MASFLHCSLLLKAQAIHNISLPPVCRKLRQLGSKKLGQVGGCDTEQIVHILLLHSHFKHATVA
jgi:hypothetical protein